MTKEAFVRQVEAMKGPMHRVACAYLRQESDRLDAVQEALLKAWRALPKLKNEAYFQTWLIRILIRECVNIQRHQRRMIPTETVPDRPAEENSQNPGLRDAILALPEQMRIVIVLRYMEETPVEEIARILRLPKGTVCSRLARARRRMKEYLKEEAEHDEA